MTAEPAATTPDADRLKRGQRQFMTGLALVMGGMVFGGGLAMVFYFLGQRESAIICAAIGGVGVIAGVVMQASAAKLLRSKSS
jgi:drug/metabolite transporter (DMT)-like permease